jgi:glycosyltransferase involved in cell wall biosynthesis
MFISTIIPTIGRPCLARAVHSVLAQAPRREPCEVIVVNDSGATLPSEDWHEHPHVTIVSTHRLNRSIARTTGAAIAVGRYLHFLDDDDWLMPGAFEAFWDATRDTSASWICGAFRLTDKAGDMIADIYPDEGGNCLINLMSREWLPLQASIVDAKAFFSIGGFAMLESLHGGLEDVHLTRQIGLRHDFLIVQRLVACIRTGDDGSTTNYADVFIQDRQSRETILDSAGSCRRLLSSARDNGPAEGYWIGKVVYYLLASGARNVREGRGFIAMSRVLHAAAGMLVAGRCVWQPDFWRGISTPHYPRVWRAIQNSGREIFQNTSWNLE